MPGAFSHLQKAASDMAYSSFLYRWSLRGAIPDRMVVKPVDPWAGDAKAGEILCEGGVPEGYAGYALHGFLWLRDLRAFAQKHNVNSQARAQARVMIESWIRQHGRWDAHAWRADLVGQRVSMWISHYDFFAQFHDVASDDDHDFQDLFFESLSIQAAHLSKLIAREKGLYGVSVLWALRGLLSAGLAFEGREYWVDQALQALQFHAEAQIFSDGMHKSRSPAELLEALQILMDVRSALLAGGYPVPEYLHGVIQKMGRALQFFRHSDRGIAAFNGAQEGGAARLDAVLAQVGLRSKALRSLPQGGYEKAILGRTSVIMDCGHAEALYQDCAHSAPLAFEMSYGRERLFVNCGTHTADDQTGRCWREALASTPAHNTLTVNDSNAYEIGRHTNKFISSCRSVNARREDYSNSIMLEARHNGYEVRNGLLHRRRLYLENDGDMLRGEDVLSNVLGVQTAQSVDIAVRFHLHPRVMVSLIRDGQEALIRMSGGTGWRFNFEAMGAGELSLSLEPSVYVGDGNIVHKSNQLAILGQAFDFEYKILWFLRREG